MEEGGWDLDSVNLNELKESKQPASIATKRTRATRWLLSGLTVAEYFRAMVTDREKVHITRFC